MTGISTGGFVRMLHKWYETTAVSGKFVIVRFPDYGNVIDVIQ